MRIAIDNISKVFDNGTRALDRVNLVIENGLYGLLGANASGKSTLIRILATLMKPSGGSVSFDGLDLKKNRAAIRSMTGYLPQRFSLFPPMTTVEFLDYSARLAGLNDRKSRDREVGDMLESLGLSEVRNRLANELSVAMKRHLEIGQAVIGDPKILLVDEPTVGLSPEERIRFGKLLAERSSRINVMIMSTHILSDISSTCRSLAVLDRGEVVYHGPPEGLPEQMKGQQQRSGDSGNAPAGPKSA